MPEADRDAITRLIGGDAEVAAAALVGLLGKLAWEGEHMLALVQTFAEGHPDAAGEVEDAMRLLRKLDRVELTRPLCYLCGGFHLRPDACPGRNTRKDT